jgi:hypothetical protein
MRVSGERLPQQLSSPLPPDFVLSPLSSALFAPNHLPMITPQFASMSL